MSSTEHFDAYVAYAPRSDAGHDDQLRATLVRHLLRDRLLKHGWVVTSVGFGVQADVKQATAWVNEILASVSPERRTSRPKPEILVAPTEAWALTASLVTSIVLRKMDPTTASEEAAGREYLSIRNKLRLIVDVAGNRYLSRQTLP